MKKPFYCFLSLFIILLFSVNIQAQIGISLNHINPKGDYAHIFKPSVGFEFVYRAADQGEKLQYGVSIGYFKLGATQESFPTYAVAKRNGQTVLYSGNETFNNYYSIPFGINLDYQFLNSKVSPFVGLDFYTHFFSYDYTSNINRIEDVSAQESSFAIGYLPKIGLSYDHNLYFTFDIGIGRSSSVEKGYSPQTYWKSYFLTTFYF